MDLGLQGKVAIVTGGSGGIGSGVCRVLAGEGVDLVVHYHAGKDRAEALAAELIRDYGVRAVALQADIGEEKDILRLYAETFDTFGGVDILINNSGAVGEGYQEKQLIENVDAGDLRRRAKIMIDGVFLMSREFVKHVKSAGKKGHIVNVLSKSAFWSGGIGNTVYVACKGADAAFTKALAHEVAPQGIFVNAIIPGYVKNSRNIPGNPFYESRLKLIPGGRFAEPEEMGYVCAFLCSDKAAQINGATIDCSGGTLNGDPVTK